MCLPNFAPCQARLWHSIIYIIFGLIIIGCYLGFSIAFYIECYSLQDTSLYPIQCGSNAMWSCMGWVPLFFFIIITILTFYYLYQQSSRTMKVISSSRAWLILFVTVACCILFFIHICYVAYICAELIDNPGCDPLNPVADINSTGGKQTYVDCSYAQQLIAILLFFSITLIIFICVSLTLIFALVNGRIATPVNYKTVKQLQDDQTDLENGHSNSIMDDSKQGEEEKTQRARQRVLYLFIYFYAYNETIKNPVI